MTAAVEHIKKKIFSLYPDEAKELMQELHRDFSVGEEDPVDEPVLVEGEWDAEIEARVKDVEEGKVELISGEDFNTHIDQLFALHGLTRAQRV